jgi:hypothetical protein
MDALLDKFTEKLIQNAMSSYMPKLKEMSSDRVAELADMKAKVRTNPDEVELWFDREITKAQTMNFDDILKKIT